MARYLSISVLDSDRIQPSEESLLHLVGTKLGSVIGKQGLLYPSHDSSSPNLTLASPD